MRAPTTIYDDTTNRCTCSSKASRRSSARCAFENLDAPQNSQPSHSSRPCKAQRSYQPRRRVRDPGRRVKIFYRFQPARIMEGLPRLEGLHQAVEAKTVLSVEHQRSHDHAETLASASTQARRMNRTAKNGGEEFVGLQPERLRDPQRRRRRAPDKHDRVFRRRQSNSRRRRSRHQGAQPERPSRCFRRHDRPSNLRVHLAHADAPGRQITRPEREGARARGREIIKTRASSARSRSLTNMAGRASTSASGEGRFDAGRLYCSGTERQITAHRHHLPGRRAPGTTPGGPRFFYLSGEYVTWRAPVLRRADRGEHWSASRPEDSR